MTPVGIALVVGFVVILVVGLVVDRNNAKKFTKEIEEKYPPKDIFGNAWVTEKGELLYYLPTGTLSGYKKWNLQEIGYIATYRGSFSLVDRNKEAMLGEYLTPSKKKFLKEKRYGTFSVGYDTVKEYIAFVKKHAPHVQHMVGGKVVD